MSSLITSASEWINDDNLNKKRTPTIRRNTKQRINLQGMGEPDDYLTQSNQQIDNFKNSEPMSINDVQLAAQDRNTRVTELLDKITSADTDTDNKKLSNFNPISHPSINVKKDMNDNTEVRNYIPQFPSYLEASNNSKSQPNNYTGDDSKINKLSNYSISYDAPVKLQNNNQPYYANMGLNNTMPRDDKLMEKINYMIHLLEEQQLEKTSNITEEFVLYSFLGVFIIFIVDSFARSGKYTR
jgi:hypothetical protein